MLKIVEHIKLMCELTDRHLSPQQFLETFRDNSRSPGYLSKLGNNKANFLVSKPDKPLRVVNSLWYKGGDFLEIKMPVAAKG